MSIRRAGTARTIGPGRTINTPQPAALQVAQAADGPAGQWPMQETDGTTMTDISGNARHGTYSGLTLAAAPIASQGEYSTSNPSNAGNAIVTYGSWMNSPSWTYEVLCYPIGFGGGGGVMGRDSAAGHVFYWLWNGTQVSSYVYTTGGAINNTGGTLGLSTNTAYLLAARLDGGSTISWWANGVKRKETSIVYSSAQPTGGDMFIQDGGGYKFQGRQAHAAMYTSALSDARLLAHAQAAGLA